MRRALALLALLVLAASLAAADSFQADTRGFGSVTVTVTPTASGSLTTFACEDPAHAMVCASKRLADLQGFGDLRTGAVPDLPATLLALPGVGAWLLYVEGSTCGELFARDYDALLRSLPPTAGWQPVKPRAYPRWLDCFDNAGPGVWVGGGGDQYVVPADFEWLKQRRLTMCTLSPTESRLVGPGLLDTSIYDWHSAMAARYDLPYRVLCFPDSHEWLWNRRPLPYVVPETGRTTTAPWLNYQRNTSATAFEPTPALDPYVLDLRRRLSEHLAPDPNWVGLHGCTEIPEAGVDLLSAVANTPGVKELWHAYLANELGADLAALGQLHHGDATYYRSWDAVDVPRPRDFLGWDPATSVDLRGTWQLHEDTARAGTEAGWQDPTKAPTDWVAGDCNDPLILLYTPQRMNEKAQQPDFWMRRTFTVPAGRAGALTWLHISRDCYHGNHTPLCGAWLNGQPLRCRSEERGDFDQCFDLGGALVEGDNTLVLNTHGAPISNYSFLSGTPLRRYPRMTPAENRLWYDTVNFDAWLRVSKIEAQLRASRAGDPNRPLKLMALINLLDLSTPLCEQYGAYQHDTGGAGGYWCPMTGARLARSHGLPFSCEQGGPPNSVADMQAALTFYLMYGNDAVDLVFGVGHYRDKPAINAWVDQNLELLHCIGKLQLPTPKLAVLRSTRATRLGFDEPWNWDIARGALQGVGRNFAYIEVPDLRNGVADQFPVIIDDGTVLLDDEDIAAIQRYVRRGGTFVAQHHTGRHSPAQADSWALAKSWGLSVTPKWITDENLHRWPLAKMTFNATQDLLPSLRGQAIEGSGVCVDYLGREHSGGIALAGNSKEIRPVAQWEDGTLALADVHAGRGRFILLGTPFYLRMKDVAGVWVNDERRGAWLDEFLTALGVPRDSWAKGVWAEAWRSKNGLFDLYPVARMSRTGDPTISATVKLRRASAPSNVREISALGHPTVPVQWADGAFTLPATDYDYMRSRVYAAPRADLERGAYDWFATQAKLWRALPPVPAVRRPAPVSVPEDLLPLADGWTLKVAGQPDRTVKLGAFATLGLPEQAQATFERVVKLPAAWTGRRVDLVFDAEHWFWGLLPQARLTVNGEPAPFKQPLNPQALPSFSFEVTQAASGGSLALVLTLDGTAQTNLSRTGLGTYKPSGATGLFYLQATAPPLRVDPLTGWRAASAFGRFSEIAPGAKVKAAYLETRFQLPATWPGRQVCLEGAGHLGFVVLNGTVLQTPSWMTRLDITGLVRPGDGENVLRWLPASRDVARWNRLWEGVVPPLALAWR